MYLCFQVLSEEGYIYLQLIIQYLKHVHRTIEANNKNRKNKCIKM